MVSEINRSNKEKFISKRLKEWENCICEATRKRICEN